MVWVRELLKGVDYAASSSRKNLIQTAVPGHIRNQRRPLTNKIVELISVRERNNDPRRVGRHRRLYPVGILGLHCLSPIHLLLQTLFHGKGLETPTRTDRKRWKRRRQALLAASLWRAKAPSTPETPDLGYHQLAQLCSRWRVHSRVYIKRMVACRVAVSSSNSDMDCWVLDPRSAPLPRVPRVYRVHLAPDNASALVLRKFPSVSSLLYVARGI